MFKLGLALVFAVIAALAIGLAGLLADVSFSTIFLRSFAGFLLAGVISYITAFVLEAKEWANFDKEVVINLPENEEKGLPEEAQAEEEAGASTEDEAAEGAFTPFSAENLDRVEPPSAN